MKDGCSVNDTGGDDADDDDSDDGGGTGASRLRKQRRPPSQEADSESESDGGGGGGGGGGGDGGSRLRQRRAVARQASSSPEPATPSTPPDPEPGPIPAPGRAGYLYLHYSVKNTDARFGITLLASGARGGRIRGEHAATYVVDVEAWAAEVRPPLRARTLARVVLAGEWRRGCSLDVWSSPATGGEGGRGGGA